MKTLSFIVPGAAVPQGSTRAFVVKGKAVTTNKTPQLIAWRNQVAQCASRAMAADNSMPLQRGPVGVYIHFHFLRPKSHKKTEYWMITQPDIEKLQRAAYDAMSGIVYLDDRQVCDNGNKKTYCSEQAYSEIKVVTLEDPEELKE